MFMPLTFVAIHANNRTFYCRPVAKHAGSKVPYSFISNALTLKIWYIFRLLRASREVTLNLIEKVVHVAEGPDTPKTPKTMFH